MHIYLQWMCEKSFRIWKLEAVSDQAVFTINTNFLRAIQPLRATLSVSSNFLVTTFLPRLVFLLTSLVDKKQLITIGVPREGASNWILLRITRLCITRILLREIYIIDPNLKHLLKCTWKNHMLCDKGVESDRSAAYATKYKPHLIPKDLHKRPWFVEVPEYPWETRKSVSTLRLQWVEI